MTKKKTTVITVVLVSLLLCCGICAILAYIGGKLPPELKLLEPSSNPFTSERPSIVIKYSCTNITKVILNNNELTETNRNDLCGTNGYHVDLKAGENIFHFKASNAEGKEASYELKVVFDLNKYNASQQELRQQEQQRNAEEANKVEDWEKRYATIKKGTISKLIKNSDQMIKNVTSNVDPYALRTATKTYKDYFVKCSGESLLKSLDPAPKEYENDFNNIKNSITTYCLSNYSLSDEVIKYLETTDIGKQYDLLDSIRYDSQTVAQNKAELQLYISQLDKTIK